MSNECVIQLRITDPVKAVIMTIGGREMDVTTAPGHTHNSSP
ncbi:4022_t:CDS:2 [Ambispora gerdemannii]|uniref:4022_t:CDS:1 n=1 Tax=Ambispora gerdemannii TaxID=144530 RepID=A0A9N9HCM6_9GLOM|nr:4022_t:CDS:2 [Ambispora gerdemannii]